MVPIYLSYFFFISQVVAGLKYDLVVEATPRAQKCQVNHFQVWDRFGDYSLVLSDVLTQECEPAPHGPLRRE